jgi:hypothetical protein
MFCRLCISIIVSDLEVSQIFYILLPLLIPIGISFTVLRLSWKSHNSRARIKMLEKDESNRQKLIHILANLEKQVEDAVADLIDNPSPDSDAESQQIIKPQARSLPPVSVRADDDQKAPPPPQILTPLQLKIAASLNTLPHLKKERAFIQRVRNSHAVIVCRDVKRFPVHRAGEGVVRYWADQFEL